MKRGERPRADLEKVRKIAKIRRINCSEVEITIPYYGTKLKYTFTIFQGRVQETSRMIEPSPSEPMPWLQDFYENAVIKLAKEELQSMLLIKEDAANK